MIVTLEAKYLKLAKYDVVHAGHYHDGTIALRIDRHGEPQTTATVCISHTEELPDDGNVFIKNWSENEGIMKALIEAGVIEPAIRKVRTGYTFAFECPLTHEMKKEIQ